MPNHIHGIIEITEPELTSLSEIIRSFKSFSARRINQLRNLKNVPVWQRNYYEHIIRDEESLEKIREYIDCNPRSWLEDQLHMPL